MARRAIARTPAAEADLIDIWIHVALDNPAAADQLLDRIGEKIALLADFPEAGVLREDIAEGVRMLAVGNYVVLYRLAASGVEVVRVVHGARDVTALF